MPEVPAVDVVETLEQLHQVKEVTELDTSGTEAGPLGQIHPIGWASAGLMVVAAVFHLRDTEWLIGNFEWWHWVGLVALVLVSLRPEPIKAVSRFLDAISDFVEEGANSFGHPKAGLATTYAVIAVFALMIGPLVSFADWVLGTSVEPVSTSEFAVSDAGNGWVRGIIAAVVLCVWFYGVNRFARGVMSDEKISLRTGLILGGTGFLVTFIGVWITNGWQPGLTAAFAVGLLLAAMAIGPLWVISWGIFIVIFFYVVTRYTARFVEADIIIGEINSLGLNLFGLLALIGVGYGVKAGVNPRIDFWWAEFSKVKKAWLDFVLHTLLFVPFLWASLRLLSSYATTNLGFKRDFSGGDGGEWPAGWHVWETWAQSSDAGNLPVGPLRATIFIGFVLFLAQIGSEMIKSGFVMIHREDLAELKQTEAPARIE